MSDDEDRPTLLYDATDGLDDADGDFELEQRRGRERMLNTWRSAVQCVMEAAQRQDEVVREDVEAAAVAADEYMLVEDQPAVPVATWVFPPKGSPVEN